MSQPYGPSDLDERYESVLTDLLDSLDPLNEDFELQVINESEQLRVVLQPTSIPFEEAENIVESVAESVIASNLGFECDILEQDNEYMLVFAPNSRLFGE